MKRAFFIIAAAISLQLISCTGGEKFTDLLVNNSGSDKSGNPTSGNGAYPTIISPLPGAQLENLKAEFKEMNPNFPGTLNKYGFIEDEVKSMEHPDTILTDENLMIQRAKAFLLKNSKFTGVTDTTAMSIFNSLPFIRGKLWMVIFNNQIYNGLEVKRSVIHVYLDANGVFRASGNWYNYIFIPDEQISEEDAKNSIIGFEIEYQLGWGGGSGIYVVNERDMINPAVKIVLVQFSGEKIELKVAWQISVRSAGWYVFVDTVTGEVLGTEQLWAD
ncbi:hypothetical protein AMJ80_10220 [bacterium SM23_31]|nr:MAG: hypothetical protein AMJ80_10220 [bacterium SM23_31]